MDPLKPIYFLGVPGSEVKNLWSGKSYFSHCLTLFPIYMKFPQTGVFLFKFSHLGWEIVQTLGKPISRLTLSCKRFLLSKAPEQTLPVLWDGSCFHEAKCGELQPKDWSPFPKPDTIQQLSFLLSSLWQKKKTPQKTKFLCIFTSHIWASSFISVCIPLFAFWKICWAPYFRQSEKEQADTRQRGLSPFLLPWEKAFRG